MIDPRPEQAARLRVRGYTIEQIARTMGIGERTVNKHLLAAKRAGIPCRRDAASPVLNELPAEIIDWLRDITPKGAKMVEIISAIIVDAYNEERDGQSRASNEPTQERAHDL